MQPKGFLWWIFSELKKPFYVNSAGQVAEGDPATLLTGDGKPAHLDAAPDGWKGSVVKYGRSLTYMGLIREFSVSLRFVKDAAKIMRYLLHTFGWEAIAFLGIHKLNRLVFPYFYDTWFLGEIDFTQAKQQQGDGSFTVNVMEGGASKLLKAYEGQTYEINIDQDPEKKVVYLDGIPFTNKVAWTVYSGQELYGQVSIPYIWLGMGIVSREGTSQGVIVQDVIMNTTVSSPVFPNDNYFLWSTDKQIAAHIQGRLTGLCIDDNFGNDSNLIVRILRTKEGVVLEERNLANASPYTKDEPFNLDINETFNVGPNERLYIRVAATPWTKPLFRIFGVEITVEYDVTFDPTQCECLTPYRVFEKLAEKIFSGKYGVRSNFLQSLDQLLITSGPALRKYGAPAAIKTSMLDFFQAMRTRSKNKMSIGLAIEGDVLVLEELDYFFKTDVILDLGTVKNLEISIAKDLLFNTIKVGYKNQEIDKVNGRDEFNITQKWTTPNTKEVKELDLVSPYRADMYGIEVTRLDLFGKDTTDNKADEDTFLLSVDKQGTIDVFYYNGTFSTEVSLGQYYIKIPTVLLQITNGNKIIISGSVSNNGVFTVVNTSYLVAGYTIIQVTEPLTNESIEGSLKWRRDDIYNLLRRPYTSVTGLMHPAESFNIELSPHRCLLNCGGYLHPMFDKMDFKDLVFQTGEKNSEMSTTIGTEVVTEKANIPIGTLTPKIFQAYYLNFTTQVPVDFTEIMANNPYGRIKIRDEKSGAIFYGHMWDGGSTPEPNDTKEWKLISASNNDFTKTI